MKMNRMNVCRLDFYSMLMINLLSGALTAAPTILTNNSFAQESGNTHEVSAVDLSQEKLFHAMTFAGVSHCR